MTTPAMVERAAGAMYEWARSRVKGRSFDWNDLEASAQEWYEKMAEAALAALAERPATEESGAPTAPSDASGLTPGPPAEAGTGGALMLHPRDHAAATRLVKQALTDSATLATLLPLARAVVGAQQAYLEHRRWCAQTDRTGVPCSTCSQLRGREDAALDALAAAVEEEQG